MNLRAVLLSPLLVGLSSCIFAADGTDVPTPDTEYRSLDSPENVLHNLVLAAGNREIDRVAELLAPEFHFRFQPENPGGTGTCESGDLDREQELAAIGALLADPEVASIRVSWVLGAAEPSTEVGKEGLTRIRTLQAWVQVETRTGITYGVTTAHQFHFRTDEGAADGPRWLLVEWEEIAVSADPSFMDGPTPVNSIRLWRLLCDYSGE